MNIVKRLGRALLRNRWVFRLIGVALFFLILLELDLREVWKTLLAVEPVYLLLSLALQLLAMVVATLRWQLIMRRLDISIPFAQSFIHQLIGTAAALVTPGQLGEFVKVLYHRREGVPVPESLFSVIIDRLFDLLMLLLLGFIALAVLFGLPAELTIVISIAGAVMVTVTFLLRRKRDSAGRWLVAQIVAFSPQAYRATMRTEAHRLATRVDQFTPALLVGGILLTAVNYVLLLLRIYALVLAIHLVVPFWFFAMIVPLLRLVGLIPISVLGIGTRDITAIYLLGQVGISEESALLVSTMGLIMLQVQALLGLIAWWRHPLHGKGDKPGADALMTANQGVAERGGQ